MWIRQAACPACGLEYRRAISKHVDATQAYSRSIASGLFYPVIPVGEVMHKRCKHISGLCWDGFTNLREIVPGPVPWAPVTVLIDPSSGCKMHEDEYDSDTIVLAASIRLLVFLSSLSRSRTEPTLPYLIHWISWSPLKHILLTRRQYCLPQGLEFETNVARRTPVAKS